MSDTTLYLRPALPCPNAYQLDGAGKATLAVDLSLYTPRQPLTEAVFSGELWAENDLLRMACRPRDPRDGAELTLVPVVERQPMHDYVIPTPRFLFERLFGIRTHTRRQPFTRRKLLRMLTVWQGNTSHEDGYLMLSRTATAAGLSAFMLPFVPFDVEEAPSKYRLECQMKHLKRVCATLQQCFPNLPTATVQEVPTATGGAAYLFVLTVKDYEHAIGEALFDTARHLALLVGNLQGAWYNMPAMTSTHLASSNSFPADRFGSGDSDYAPALLLEEYADWGYYLYSA
jgi:hypothetical protein